MNNQHPGRWQSICNFVRLRASRGVPYAKVFALMAASVASWAFATQGFGEEGWGLFALGILGASLYTHFFSWGLGAAFGIVTIIFLGPVMTIVAPHVTSMRDFCAALVGAGFFFGVLMSIVKEIAALDEAAEDALVETELGKRLLGFEYGLIPVACVLLVAPRLDKEVTILAGIGLYYVGAKMSSMGLRKIDLRLRPAAEFFGELMPLLRVMSRGLVSFGLGYGLTTLLFAGFYAALYQANPLSFHNAEADWHPSVWDFIYFSVTTITTVGLSDLKPEHDFFWPQACVSLELIAGIFWVVVYFALAMSLLQTYARDLLESSGRNTPNRSQWAWLSARRQQRAAAWRTGDRSRPIPSRTKGRRANN